MEIGSLSCGINNWLTIICKNLLPCALLYSSNWSGTVTNEVPINGGNIQVRSSTPSPTNHVSKDAYSEVIDKPAVVAKPFKVTAWPNPTQHYFNLIVEGNSNETVVVKLFDINGRQVYVTRGAANQTYSFGEKFAIGVYIVEVRQGDKKSILKLIKQ